MIQQYPQKGFLSEFIKPWFHDNENNHPGRDASLFLQTKIMLHFLTTEKMGVFGGNHRVVAILHAALARIPTQDCCNIGIYDPLCKEMKLEGTVMLEAHVRMAIPNRLSSLDNDYIQHCNDYSQFLQDQDKLASSGNLFAAFLEQLLKDQCLGTSSKFPWTLSVVHFIFFLSIFPTNSIMR